MRLVSFVVAERASWGIAEGTEISDVGSILGSSFRDLREVIAANAYSDAQAASKGAPKLPPSKVKWQPVIVDPQKILCVGLNYETHRLETGRAHSGHPTIFTRFADTQVGHEANLIRPAVSTEFDYEGELAVVIGKGGRYISRAEAMRHVAGYACYNDATIRDWQRHTTQFTPGKNFPGTGAFGPALVTADEVSNLDALRLLTRVNGVTVQEAGLDQLIFPIPVLIEYCSTFTPLNAGDVIATGTPGGVGFRRNPPLFLKAGDCVEVYIPGIGLLVNHVADEAR
jgi:2-keto-4-pentenoate hydratase/2-oxohepta-3-ene-1,7-dioic acid hydratase in catechol pathway